MPDCIVIIVRTRRRSGLERVSCYTLAYKKLVGSRRSIFIEFGSQKGYHTIGTRLYMYIVYRLLLLVGLRIVSYTIVILRNVKVPTFIMPYTDTYCEVWAPSVTFFSGDFPSFIYKANCARTRSANWLPISESSVGRPRRQFAPTDMQRSNAILRWARARLCITEMKHTRTCRHTKRETSRHIVRRADCERQR